MKLSILMPVYNERTVVERSISLVMTAPLPESMDRELIIIDDCSTDGTWDILQRLAAAYPEIRLYRHAKNAGKGAAVRTAISKAEGDFSIIQDADLEYDPGEYRRVLEPLLDGRADMVYGSRFLGGPHRVMFFWHYAGNRLLTLLSNMISDLNLSDMETGMKAFRRDKLLGLRLSADRFTFEPEITCKAARARWKIYEVPISYSGRTYEEGKKIGWRDAIAAIAAILYYRFAD
jgi:glycosyltransferase involved in cell wall biosynthesis